MTWEIISGLIVLVGFLITLISVFVKYTNKNTETLTKLGNSFDSLSLTFKEFKEDFKKELKEVKEKTQDHETRIRLLEERKGE